MIIKSMSRKVPSFGQLLEYIDRDEEQGEHTLRHNLMGRSGEHITAEFDRNSELLQKRKNGVYLYHEIISITRAEKLEGQAQIDRLVEISQEYIAARCPDNLVYGDVHQDKDHSYHMHLMISANRAGDSKRLRLSKAQFRQIQVQLEEHVLQKYPELEQKLAIGKRSDRGRNKGESELERRTGKRPKREIILARVQAAYEQSDDRQSLLEALGHEGLELYVRGKTLGVIDHESGKKHRLKTLDLETSDRIAIRMEGGELDRSDPELEEAVAQEKQQAKPQAEQAKADRDSKKFAGEKEKVAEVKRKAESKVEFERENKGEPKRQTKKRRPKIREDEPENTRTQKADKECYVKSDSNADLNRGPVPKQKRSASKEKNKENRKHKSTRENDMRGKEPPAYGSDENIARRVEIDRGERTPDPEMDIMTHEDGSGKNLGVMLRICGVKW